MVHHENRIMDSLYISDKGGGETTRVKDIEMGL